MSQKVDRINQNRIYMSYETKQKVIKRAIEVFQDTENAHKWLNTPNRALDNKIPMNLLQNPTAAQMVLDVLGRIEHGVYS